MLVLGKKILSELVPPLREFFFGSFVFLFDGHPILVDLEIRFDSAVLVRKEELQVEEQLLLRTVQSGYSGRSCFSSYDYAHLWPFTT